jgi:hypothetical protein
MPKAPSSPEPIFALAGWQGMTIEMPEDWNLGSISGDPKGGYLRYDDDNMPRLEIKWSVETGFVDLNKVIDKYLREIEKGHKKASGEISIERDIKLISKRQRKKAGLKCFHWRADLQGYGAAWLCKDCGRTVIAQVMCPGDQDPEAAQELAASILLSIEDHPRDGWVTWSAYGFIARAPEDFHLSGQKLQAGLIEFEFDKDTEKLKLARWSMASIALKGRSLRQWADAELARTLRKQNAEIEPAEIMGHEALRITGGNIGGAQKLQRFAQHCAGKLYADRLIACLWHCEASNKIHYVETFVDRANVALVDDLVAHIACHPDADQGAKDG